MKTTRTKRGSTIAEFGPALLILILATAGITGLLTVGTAYISGLYLNYLEVRELANRRESDAPEAIRQIKREWERGIFARLAGARAGDTSEVADYASMPEPLVTVTTRVRGRTLFGGNIQFVYTSSRLQEVR
ncbi:MAG: hypothetical protein K2W95_28310 [Candidatus Obscuribacterales bacterium]|nr:hypothetical protein [Candidatus Obscuribacterales bacterium]